VAVVAHTYMLIISANGQRRRSLQIPAHRGQSFRRIADSVPVIADSF
jgi:hypothetical protein